MRSCPALPAATVHRCNPVGRATDRTASPPQTPPSVGAIAARTTGQLAVPGSSCHHLDCAPFYPAPRDSRHGRSLCRMAGQRDQEPDEKRD
ncbi:MAG: hypothetical protein KME13_17320 [Myxacorys californica WJT36-NPBG1]|nr:hypothetical protein [Myxacorys californica WJT36-NPBG1]